MGVGAVGVGVLGGWLLVVVGGGAGVGVGVVGQGCGCGAQTVTGDPT